MRSSCRLCSVSGENGLPNVSISNRVEKVRLSFTTTNTDRSGDGLFTDLFLSAFDKACQFVEFAGQLLQIPDASLGLPRYTSGVADAETYAVHRGEAVFEVARRFGVDATALARTNGIGVNAPLSEGAELLIPGRLARMNALLTYVAGDIAVDARLMRAVAWAESTWRQEVVSSTGAVGVMQLEPYTGDWVSRHVAGRRLDIWVAQDNVLAGGLLLKHIGGLHDGDVGATLAAYYQGAEFRSPCMRVLGGESECDQGSDAARGHRRAQTALQTQRAIASVHRRSSR